MSQEQQFTPLEDILNDHIEVVSPSIYTDTEDELSLFSDDISPVAYAELEARYNDILVNDPSPNSADTVSTDYGLPSPSLSPDSPPTRYINHPVIQTPNLEPVSPVPLQIYTSVSFEADLQEYTPKHYNVDNLINNVEDADFSNLCLYDNFLTGEPYSYSKDLLMVHLPNSQGIFPVNGECLNLEGLSGAISSALTINEYNKPNLDIINCLWTTPKDFNPAGFGGYPTSLVFIKLPLAVVLWVTLSSIVKLTDNIGKQQHWYAVPLFGGLKRRVGNIRGIFGISMNHGQGDGNVVYKLYSRKEILAGITADITDDDYLFGSMVDLRAFETLENIELGGDEIVVSILETILDILPEN
jgi:hypothetical protein